MLAGSLSKLGASCADQAGGRGGGRWASRAAGTPGWEPWHRGLAPAGVNVAVRRERCRAWCCGTLLRASCRGALYTCSQRFLLSTDPPEYPCGPRASSGRSPEPRPGHTVGARRVLPPLFHPGTPWDERGGGQRVTARGHGPRLVQGCLWSSDEPGREGWLCLGLVSAEICGSCSVLHRTHVLTPPALLRCCLLCTEDPRSRNSCCLSPPSPVGVWPSQPGRPLLPELPELAFFPSLASAIPTGPTLKAVRGQQQSCPVPESHPQSHQEKAPGRVSSALPGLKEPRRSWPPRGAGGTPRSLIRVTL